MHVSPIPITLIITRCCRIELGRVKDEFFRGQAFESFEELKEKLEEYIAHWTRGGGRLD